jgi:hypothetical protein
MTPEMTDLTVGGPDGPRVTAVNDEGSMMNCISYELAELMERYMANIRIDRSFHYSMTVATGQLTKLAGVIPKVEMYFRGRLFIGTFLVMPPNTNSFHLLWGAPMNTDAKMASRRMADGSTVMKLTNHLGETVVFCAVQARHPRNQVFYAGSGEDFWVGQSFE